MRSCQTQGVSVVIMVCEQPLWRPTYALAPASRKPAWDGLAQRMLKRVLPEMQDALPALPGSRAR